MEVTDILKKYSKSIDEEIQNSLGTVDPDELQKSTQHLIKAGGKKIRPSLVVLSSEAVGGK
jgi:geranylgeranyl diphosphate synthase type I